MYISRVVVRNFRNFELLDVPLEHGTTCVLGENNSGKSNLMFALRLALDSNLSSHARTLDPHDIHQGASLSNPQQVLVSLEFRDYDDVVGELALVGTWEVDPGVARLTYRFRPRPAVVEALQSGEREEGSLEPDDYHWELCGGGDFDPRAVTWEDPIGSSIRFGDLQHFEVFRMPALRDVVALLRQRRTSPIRRLLDLSDVAQDERDELVDVLARANDEIADQPTIRGMGDRIERSFQSTAGRAYPMGLRLGMSDPSFASISTALNILLTDGMISDFEPSRNGLGLNNVLYISMFLDYFDVLSESEDTAGHLLLVEEPEAHLHPLLQRVLYRILASRDSQVILTTHSTFITSQAPLRSVVALSRDAASRCTGCIPATTPGLTEGEVDDIERYLDATRSVLLYARKVLLVEGAAEWFLVPPLVESVLDVDLDSEGIAIVPIFGRHFHPYAKLFAPEGLPKRCAVLADRDLEEAPVAGEDLPPDALDDLIVQDRVEVFLCDTTFERELVLPGTLDMLAAAARDLPAPGLAGRLEQAQLDTALGEEVDWPALGDAVLRTAKRFGKGRFAQVVARHAAIAESVPAYVADAINWLRDAD